MLIFTNSSPSLLLWQVLYMDLFYLVIAIANGGRHCDYLPLAD